MEATELKQLMKAYENKLDRSLQLNVSSLDKVSLATPKQSTNKVLRNRVFEVITFGILAIFIGWYIASNVSQTHLVVSGVIVHVFTLVALIGSIGQVVFLKQIDYSKPIIEIRTKIERVNAHELLFVKLIFLSAPVWWAYTIVAIDVFLGVDFFQYLETDFVSRYLVTNMLLILPLIWFFRILSYHNLHKKWVRKTLAIFTSAKTLEALNELKKLEEFEK